MKIALYIEDGLEQVVLTPESETEKAILGKLENGSRDLSIRYGQFFHCQGGYVHQNSGPRSTMIVLTPAVARPPALDILGLADIARAEAQNTPVRFLGDDPRAREIAEGWRMEVADLVYAAIAGNAA